MSVFFVCRKEEKPAKMLFSLFPTSLYLRRASAPPEQAACRGCAIYIFLLFGIVPYTHVYIFYVLSSARVELMVTMTLPSQADEAILRAVEIFSQARGWGGGGVALCGVEKTLGAVGTMVEG